MSTSLLYVFILHFILLSHKGVLSQELSIFQNEAEDGSGQELGEVEETVPDESPTNACRNINSQSIVLISSISVLASLYIVDLCREF